MNLIEHWSDMNLLKKKNWDQIFIIKVNLNFNSNVKLMQQKKEKTNLKKKQVNAF